MKNDKSGGFQKFKKALIVIGVVAALAVLYAAIFVLIPFVMEMHAI